ncbi:peptidyl-prolyl cis-trans isomerase [Thalassotalea sp. HSM 43]|nr:peptidyl-prolyl cis-trans isomerase [Thalassotalea sp. HSM 43]
MVIRGSYMLKRIIRDPLLHFLLLSATILLAYQWRNQQQNDDYMIVVSEGRVQQLKNDIVDRKQRQPVAQELDIAIQSYALNEIYLKEARELGLNKGDRVIDRRLRQKMEYLLEEMALVQSPSEQELKAYYQEHSDRYLAEETYSFSQVYISIDRSEQELNNALKQQQQRIAQGLLPQGDASMLTKKFEQRSSAQIQRQFGAQFSDKLKQLPLNTWSEAIDSGYGKHFVMVREHTPAAPRDYEAVKETVLYDWQYDMAQSFKQAYESELLERYQINIEKPQGDS